ncbi:MAG: hypothetical protein AAF771_01320 [Pseudomonadota bacterium]
MSAKTVFLATALAFGMASAAQAGDVVAQMPASEDWFEFEMRWTEGPASYKALWMAMPVEDDILICGVGQFTRNDLLRESRRALRDMGFYIDDALFLQDLSFFSKGAGRGSLVGATANCASTGKAPPPIVTMGVSLRNTKRGRVVY